MEYKNAAEEKEQTANASVNAIFEFIGTEKLRNEKIDKGIGYLTWMLALGLIMSVLFIISQFYQRYADNNFTGREKLLSNREKLFIERVRQKDYQDSLGNVALSQRRKDQLEMQANLNKREALLNKRDSILKLAASKTINTNIVNTKSLNIKK